MIGGALGFAALAVNPLGGLLVAIPFGLLQQHYPVAVVVGAGVPLAYVQVVVVDVGWSLLIRWAWWNRMLARRRSPRVERLAASRGSFWLTVLLAPIVGPWLVMAVLRYANVPQRRVALPIFLGLLWNAIGIATVCLAAPRLLHLLHH